jgi:2-polyprenyl-6-methoxyphenol hydroxylase-like FAD-dependent oxidoreductase
MCDSLIYDVVIAGAGPVGLFLACELRLANLSVLVLEQASSLDSPLKALPFGMRGLSIATVEALYRRGLLPEIEARRRDSDQLQGSASGARGAQQARRPGGHFAGIQFFLDTVDTSTWPLRLPGSASPLTSTMEHIESVLSARAHVMGVDIRYGCGVESFEQSSDEVTVQAAGKTYRAHWLVGCDGGRSTVRKVGNFEFSGTEPEFTGYSVEIGPADPDQLAAGRHYTETGMYNFQPPGTLAMADFDDGAFHRTRTITSVHVQTVLRRISGKDATVTALHFATTWTDRAYQATTYRNGRVLLAGDAAHIHSPLGGQGLNLGLGDAMNLGWKLAATVRGTAPHDLLDSYGAERHPPGSQVLDWSRAQVALMRPSPSSRALAAIIGDLIETRDGASYFAKRVWGTSLRYDLDRDHDLVGRSAPDFELTDGTKLGDLLSAGRGVLLDFHHEAPLRKLARRWGDQLLYVASDAKDTLGLTAALIRPDGIVAWASEVLPVPEDCAMAATRWFGQIE